MKSKLTITVTIIVAGFPKWPKYSLKSPTNIVFNATETPDVLNVHVEPDTWREEGMALWPKYAMELDLLS